MDNSVTVSQDQSRHLGVRLGELQPKVEDFVDPHLFPSSEYEPEEIARFFFFVTGIDHRTSPPNQSFEGRVDGEYFQGADLLWHLSLRKFTENPQLFHPKAMADITPEIVTEWYTVKHPKQVTIRNPAERAALLRNGGQLLLDDHDGAVLTLLKTANHRVTPKPTNANPGLLSLLSQFKAYEDPARKKSFLFLKFLLRRNLWAFTDDDQVRIPVDNHLTRIALRTGIVNISPDLASNLKLQRPVSLETDVNLRERIGDAYSLVGESAQRSVLELDDFFWHFGRQCCLHVKPICVIGCTTSCFVVDHLLNEPCRGICPLSKVCPASNDDAQRALVEPTLDTWYY